MQRPNSPPSPVAKRAGDVTIGNMGGNFRFGSLSLRHKGLYSMEIFWNSFLQKNGFILKEILESYGKRQAIARRLRQ